MIFFSKYNRTGVLTNHKLEMNMPQIFKTKCILDFEKIEKNEELMAQY